MFHEHTLCSIEDVPMFLQFNPYVRKGYRKPNLTFGECCKSLFYLHNESTNIYLHLMPAGLMFYFMVTEKSGYTKISALAYFLMFFGSVVYHTFMPLCR